MEEECDKKKYKGEVMISGKIFLNQFFSVGTGRSDADTVKILMTPQSIKFRKSKDDPWLENLTLLNDAFYYNEEEGRRKNILLTNRTDGRKYIIIRLQGIDAPELHYPPNRGGLELFYEQYTNFRALSDMFEFRQYWGARAAKELADFLRANSDGNEYLDASAISSIDKPSNLFDKFGRAVADIIIHTRNKEEINLNHWLVENGWAFADFYDSMSNDEILGLEKKSKEAEVNKKGIWSTYSSKLVPFDFDMNYPRKPSELNIDNDKGQLNLPKLFRKQVDFEIIKRTGFKMYNEITTLKKYIKYRKSECYKLQEFLEKRHCAKRFELSEFIKDDGSMTYTDADVAEREVLPGSLVNIESDSYIESRNIINDWF
jgi:endonuclease YncB( thermonuclease family)